MHASTLFLLILKNICWSWNLVMLIERLHSLIKVLLLYILMDPVIFHHFLYPTRSRLWNLILVIYFKLVLSSWIKCLNALLSSLHLSLVRNEFDGNHFIHRTSILRTSGVQRQLLVVLGGVWWSIRHAGWAPLPPPSIGSNKIYGWSVDGFSLSPHLHDFPSSPLFFHHTSK